MSFRGAGSQKVDILDPKGELFQPNPFNTLKKKHAQNWHRTPTPFNFQSGSLHPQRATQVYGTVHMRDQKPVWKGTFFTITHHKIRSLKFTIFVKKGRFYKSNLWRGYFGNVLPSKKNIWKKRTKKNLFRNRSQTLVRGLIQKGGALKIFDPCKEGPEKKLAQIF